MGNPYIGVNGVARSITNGYIGINNIARQIKKAYIGDDNNIARLCWEKPFPFSTLSEMFAAANVYRCEGVHDDDRVTFSMSNVPLTGLYYCITHCGGYIGIYKLKDGVLTSLYRAYLYKAGLILQGSTLYYTEDNVGASTTCGTAIALITFPDFEEEYVDRAIIGMNYVDNKGSNSTSSASILSFTPEECALGDVVFVCFGGRMSIYSGSDPTKSILDLSSIGAGTYSEIYGLCAYSEPLPSPVYHLFYLYTNSGTIITINTTGIK